MKLFISLIAIFFLIAGCGDEGEEETGAGDDTVVGDGENPEANEADEAVDEATDPEVENLADSGSNSVSVTCVPHERVASNAPVQIPGDNLELTQSGEFDCPQVAPYNCSSCELRVNSSSGSATIYYVCTGIAGPAIVRSASRNGTFIRQIGMSCTNNNL